MPDSANWGFSWSRLAGVPFTVLGLGRCGVAAGRALVAAGAQVQVFDDHASPELQMQAEQQLGADVQVASGTLPETRPGEVYVVSPGFVADSPAYFDAVASGCPVIDESEVFHHLRRARFPGAGGPVVGITGTNGKTSTTELIGHLLRSAGRHVAVGGNIGVPLCSSLDELTPETVVVAELSEISLLGQVEFHCDVAVITNIDYDHVIGLPVFGGAPAAYHACKWRITSNLTAADMLVYSADCLITASMVDAAEPVWQPEPVSVGRRLHRGWWMDGTGHRWSGPAGAELLVSRCGDVSTLSVDGETVLLGEHNQSNVLLSLATVTALGIGPEALPIGLASFRTPAHRINVVPGTPDGVVVIDDSKATNPHAALAAIEVVRRRYPDYKMVWVGGGQSDSAPKAELVAAVAIHASAAVLLGESAREFAELLGDSLPTTATRSMPDAVRAALAAVGDGTGVLLFSPASKSFDMFRDYVHRAEVFRAAVRDAVPAGS